MQNRRQVILQRIAKAPEELLPELELSVADILDNREQIYRLSDDERASIRAGIEAAQRGEFVSGEEFDRMVARYPG